MRLRSQRGHRRDDPARRWCDRAELTLRGELAEVLHSLAARAHRKGLELVGDIADDVPDRVIGDAGRLRLEGRDYVVADGDVMHFRCNL